MMSLKCCKKHKNVTRTQSEEMVGKMALPDEGSHQPSTCKKKKKRERERERKAVSAKSNKAMHSKMRCARIIQSSS